MSDVRRYFFPMADLDWIRRRYKPDLCKAVTDLAVERRLQERGFNFRRAIHSVAHMRADYAACGIMFFQDARPAEGPGISRDPRDLENLE